MPFKSNLTDQEREQVLTWCKEGVYYAEIAKRLDYKISKQRVHQIAKKHKVDSKQIRQQKILEKHEEQMSSKWGENWKNKEWRKSAIYQAMREKFRNKQKNTTNVDFTITFGEITFPTHCPILGIELDYFAPHRAENSPSFDRIDPSKGYISGNVAIISWRANRIKNDGTAEEHKKIAKFIENH